MKISRGVQDAAKVKICAAPRSWGTKQQAMRRAKRPSTENTKAAYRGKASSRQGIGGAMAACLQHIRTLRGRIRKTEDSEFAQGF